MQDESSDSVLAELNAKKQRFRVAPLVAVVGSIAAGVAWTSMAPVAQIASVIAIAVFVFFAFHWDKLKKTTVILYDLEPEVAKSYERLVNALTDIQNAQGLWHVATHAQVLDRKYHAGAAEEIERTATSIRSGQPPFVKTNLDIPSVNVGSQTLYFFPDRLLVFPPEGVGSVPYQSLTVERSTTRFIESDTVPRDSRVVGRTWRYVNKNGGPDRRFSNNRELPICEYECLSFRSRSGLNELLHVSKVGAGEALSKYLTEDVYSRAIEPSAPKRLLQ
jgi:hypothetical protein